MVITEQKDLVRLCKELEKQDFLTIDTEFLRDKTYYPKLCLIQMAGPETDAAAIDPLCDTLDLQPVYDVLANEKVLKVFHAARQDLEIFYNLTGTVPVPLFDTQVAAMVCGHGEQVGYNNLVAAVCGHTIDKGPQFTDWSRRPLSRKQLDYALNDVTYLRDVYRKLSEEVAMRGRESWVRQEMAILNDPATYSNPPEESWHRIKIRTLKPRVLAVLREVAAWREREAQRRDIPRVRVLRDETLADMAIHMPQSVDDLLKIRNMPSDVAKGRWGQELLKAIETGQKTPKDRCPQVERRERMPQDRVPVLEMLKMLLRIQASENEVAAKLIISGEDLEALAMDDNADIPAMKGWRYEIFGKEAVALKNGRLSLSLKDGRIVKLEK